MDGLRRLAVAFVVCFLAALAFTAARPLVAAADEGFEITTFSGMTNDNNGTVVTQAGSHPNVTTTLEVSSGSNNLAAATMRNVRTEFPAGLILNPTAASTCTSADLAGAGGDGYTALCPGSAQVGLLNITLNTGSGPFLGGVFPLYNVEVGPNERPRVAANVSSVVVNFEAVVRTGGDYGIDALLLENSESLPLQGASVTLWGVPADPQHDAERFCATVGPVIQGCSANHARKPFVSYLSPCNNGLLTTGATVSAWDTTAVRTASFDHDAEGHPLEVTGCGRVGMSPSFQLRPESRRAGAPTGVEATLRIPQVEEPDGYATALLRNAKVTLPEGMTINAASAEGQTGCAPGQIGMDSAAATTCPDSSKLGSVEIETPLLNKPLVGSIYLAKQGENPFGSLLAIYVAAEGYGQAIKFAGRIEPNPSTGRLEVTFLDNPQLPFEQLRLRFRGGPRAPVVNPNSCGTFTTLGEFSTWSQPDATLKSGSSFVIDEGCGNSSQFKPGFEAGTANPIAGSYSPFTLRVTRADGEQNVSTISATLPAGLLAKLAGVPLCGDAEAATGNCPLGSQVGTTTVGTGAGSNPLYVPQPGKQPTAVYLAGPYKGAPYSLVVKVPAQAGPFDLGTVAVRNALQIDPSTTQVTATSDPLPQILQGIPITYRDVRVEINRPEFTVNPTNCDPTDVRGAVGSSVGASAAVSSPFQVANCERLAFAPKLALRLLGAPPRRGANPALQATVTAGKGEANIGRASVILPATELLEQSHIRTVCTRVQFAAGQCPTGSIYGRAKAITPLLDQPLEGPVYLRSNGGERELPDLVADLNGQIHVVLVGYIDSVKRQGAPRIRTRFVSVPDAPISKFVLNMQGGKKSLLANNTNLCKAGPRAEASLTGQNGKAYESQPLVSVGGCGKKAGNKK